MAKRTEKKIRKYLIITRNNTNIERIPLGDDRDFIDILLVQDCYIRDGIDSQEMEFEVTICGERD